MNIPTLFCFDLALIVDRLTENVEHPAEHFLPDRSRELSARIADAHSAGQSIRRRHGDTADYPLLFVRIYFEDSIRAVYYQFFVDGRHIIIKLHVDDRADDLTDPTLLCHVFALPFDVDCFQRRTFRKIGLTVLS